MRNVKSPSGAGGMAIALCRAVVLFCVVAGTVSGSEPVPPIRLVDMHTAGMVPKGDYSLEVRIYENYGTGFLVSIAAGITDRFCFGLGYGAEGIVGRSREVHYNPFPGCIIKYRLLEEDFYLPGIALGFDYQGFGGIGDEGRFGYYGYIYKSQGFFAAFSKSYLFLRVLELGLHGNINLSLEEIAKVTWPDAWVGVDMGVSDKFSLVAEYDFGFNTRDPYGSRNAYALPYQGYCNLGIRLHFTPHFSLEIDARDVFENRAYLINRANNPRELPVGWSRELKVTYLAPIKG
ncbi:MAG: hypothetical protein JXA71_17240 [Chitinispirillaceae bacterium]|nr:hypothetical protein [Chitinispirillaceae bacterium]